MKGIKTVKKCLLVLLLAYANVSSAASDTAIVTISGTVRENTCSLANSSMNITLPDIAVRDFNGVTGVTRAGNTFDIQLKDCGDMASKVKITLEGLPDQDNNSAFANVAPVFQAKGVGLFLTLSGPNSLLPAPTTGINGYKKEISISPGSNNIKFYAAYMSTKDVVTAGNFQAIVNVIFDYI